MAGARVVDAQVGIFYSRGFLDYGSGPLIQNPRAPCVTTGGHTNSCGCYGGGVCYGHQLSETLEGAARYPGGMAPGYVLDSQANFDLAKPASWTCSSYIRYDEVRDEYGKDASGNNYIAQLPAYNPRTGECFLARPNHGGYSQYGYIHAWMMFDYGWPDHGVDRLCRCYCGVGFFQPLDAITNTCSRYVPLPTRLAPAPALGNSSARGSALFCFRHVDSHHACPYSFTAAPPVRPLRRAGALAAALESTLRTEQTRAAQGGWVNAARF